MNPNCIGKIGLGIGAQRNLHLDLKKNLDENSEEKPPLINFSPVNENQLVKDTIAFSTYAKGSFLQTKELVYRILKTDARLVRSILEQSGFGYTDSHNWNFL